MSIATQLLDPHATCLLLCKSPVSSQLCELCVLIIGIVVAVLVVCVIIATIPYCIRCYVGVPVWAWHVSSKSHPVNARCDARLHWVNLFSF